MIASLALTLWSGLCNAAEPGEDAAQGAILYVSLCASCHGPNGAARGMPQLAGRPAARLIAQIQSLREDAGNTPRSADARAAVHARPFELMNAAQLGDLAAYVSMLVAPPPVSNSP
jgi:mono/diheme cytochrome c family protein